MKHVSICEACNAGYDLTLTACPYCACSSQMSYAHELEPIVVDVETYRHYWLLEALNPATGETWSFEMFEGKPLDVIGIRNLLTTNTIVTFNGIKYDMPIITLALSGASCSQLKDASDAIITQNMQPWEFYRAYGLTEPTSVDHIDLIEVAPGQGSLKAYGGRMHTRKLQDLPYPPDMVIEWPHRIMLREYCFNDLAVTAELYAAMRDRVILREKIGEKNGIDVRSKSDPQISEAIMRVRLGRSPKAPIIQVGHQFIYKAPAWLKFKHLDIDVLLTHCPFAITESGSVAPAYSATFIDWPDTQMRLDPHGQWVKRPKGWSARSLIINGTQYAMGIGGLHSMESSITWEATNEMSLTMPDVGSYYPSLMLETGIYPAAIGPEFTEIFREKYNSRLAAKARAGELKVIIKNTIGVVDPQIERDLEQALLITDTEKLNLNGNFGKLGSKYSMFYTPDGLIQVTITGQLALLMLIEALEDAGIHVVSANTDGIVIYTARSNDWMTQSIIAWWEQTTGFMMETTEFKMLAAMNVNSYIGIEANGSVKAKGMFAPVKPGASGWPNPTGQVCVDAVVAYLKDGTPLRDTIMACSDVRQFVYVRSVTGGASYMPHGTMSRKTTQTAMRAVVGDIADKVALTAAYHAACDARSSTGEYLGKVVRWYYGCQSEACLVTKAGNLVPRTQGCRPLMELPDTVPDDVDREWYVTEAESLLADIGFVV
jgi:hypothetical protein